MGGLRCSVGIHAFNVPVRNLLRKIPSHPDEGPDQGHKPMVGP